MSILPGRRRSLFLFRRISFQRIRRDAALPLRFRLLVERQQEAAQALQDHIRLEDRRKMPFPEAVEHLGLHVEKPTMDFYKVIKAVYDDISKELEFETPYNPT